MNIKTRAMKKPVNKSEQRGERKGFIKGFLVAIAMMIILAMCTHSAHAQLADAPAELLTTESTMYRDNDLKPASMIDVSVNDSAVVIDVFAGSVHTYEINSREQIGKGVEKIEANGLELIHFSNENLIKITKFYCGDLPETAYFKLKV